MATTVSQSLRLLVSTSAIGSSRAGVTVVPPRGRCSALTASCVACAMPCSMGRRSRSTSCMASKHSDCTLSVEASRAISNRFSRAPSKTRRKRAPRKPARASPQRVSTRRLASFRLRVGERHGHVVAVAGVYTAGHGERRVLAGEAEAQRGPVPRRVQLAASQGGTVEQRPFRAEQAQLGLQPARGRQLQPAGQLDGNAAGGVAFRQRPITAGLLGCSLSWQDRALRAAAVGARP